MYNVTWANAGGPPSRHVSIAEGSAPAPSTMFRRISYPAFSRAFSSMCGTQILLTNMRIGHLCVKNFTGKKQLLGLKDSSRRSSPVVGNSSVVGKYRGGEGRTRGPNGDLEGSCTTKKSIERLLEGSTLLYCYNSVINIGISPCAKRDGRKGRALNPSPLVPASRPPP
ncbi:hypothetical protein HAX54_019334 [Datura stramonium]|uniref:Uncharacterized protein n=1 Tax=Datura stramonium TaxID=4076 RepID=A0ABS8UNZ1_DATST|nr:hypothetical protein [Datura stramonium]